MARLYLGVDGGQSSTSALIADEAGRIIGRGSAGPCNHVRSGEGREKFLSAVGGSLNEACLSAGLDPASVVFAAACLGFSGGPEDKDALSRELVRSHRYKITHDAEIALTGATGGKPGIIVIAGTGSMAFGRNARGETARAGGWGYVFGDEGGAFDLVRQALRAALRYEEGWGEQTSLRGILLEATGTRDANDLLHHFYTSDYPRTRIATFAPLVSRAASEGDGAALKILETGARQLSEFALAIRARLFASEESVQLAYVGGVFESSQLLKNFKNYLASEAKAIVEEAKLPPDAGALLEAFSLERKVSEVILDSLIARY